MTTTARDKAELLFTSVTKPKTTNEADKPASPSEKAARQSGPRTLHLPKSQNVDDLEAELVTPRS